MRTTRAWFVALVAMLPLTACKSMTDVSGRPIKGDVLLSVYNGVCRDVTVWFKGDLTQQWGIPAGLSHPFKFNVELPHTNGGYGNYYSGPYVTNSAALSMGVRVAGTTLQDVREIEITQDDLERGEITVWIQPGDFNQNACTANFNSLPVNSNARLVRFGDLQPAN